MQPYMSPRGDCPPHTKASLQKLLCQAIKRKYDLNLAMKWQCSNNTCLGCSLTLRFFYPWCKRFLFPLHGWVIKLWMKQKNLESPTLTEITPLCIRLKKNLRVSSCQSKFSWHCHIGYRLCRRKSNFALNCWWRLNAHIVVYGVFVILVGKEAGWTCA